MTAVLAAERLSVDYGGVHALVDVDLEVQEGQLVGLIGPNGAGKTTFIDAITGFARSSGTVRIDGADVSRLAPHERARRGMARTWQSADLFDDLTIRENVEVGVGTPSMLENAREILLGRPTPFDAADRTLELLGLTDLANALPDQTGQSVRKLVGVARALAAQPRVLLLDEPAAGLDTRASLELGGRLRALADGGSSMLLIEHDMGLVLSVCDVVTVLDFGRVIASGPPEAVRADPAVVEAYLGTAGKRELGLTEGAHG